METIYRKGKISPNDSQRLLRRMDFLNGGGLKVFKKRFRMADGSRAIFTANRLGMVPSHTVKIIQQAATAGMPTFSPPVFFIPGGTFDPMLPDCERPVWALVGVANADGTGSIDVYDAGTAAGAFEYYYPVNNRWSWDDCTHTRHHQDAALRYWQNAEGIVFDSWTLAFPIGNKIATLYKCEDAGFPFKMDLVYALIEGYYRLVVLFADTYSRVYALLLDLGALAAGGGEVSTSDLSKLEHYWVFNEDVRALHESVYEWTEESKGWYFPVYGKISTVSGAMYVSYHESQTHGDLEDDSLINGGIVYFFVGDDGNKWMGTLSPSGELGYIGPFIERTNTDSWYLSGSGFYDLLCDGNVYGFNTGTTNPDTGEALFTAPTAARIPEATWNRFVRPYAVYTRYDELTCADALPIFERYRWANDFNG